MSNELNCELKCKGANKKPYISNSFIVSKPKCKVLERLLSEEYLSNIDFTAKANPATRPYYVRSGILRKSDVEMLLTSMIYPYNYGNKKEMKNFDKCFSTEEVKGFKKYDYFNGHYYIKFPCMAYPNAVMIKNFLDRWHMEEVADLLRALASNKRKKDAV